MVIVSNQAENSIVGKVLRITFEKSSVKYLEFELQGGDKCFCRGNAAPGKDFNNLTPGANVKLYGKWAVSKNPKYKSMGEQFNFSDYELLSSTEAASRKTPEVTSSPAKEASIQNQEEVRGYIVRFRPYTNNYRIFLLRSIDGREFWCQGNIDPSKVPFENNKVRLIGTWRTNSRHPEYGLQFYFTSYDIITSGKPEKVIRRPRTITEKAIPDALDQRNDSEKIISYLKAISGKKITYEFHKPKHASILEHVKFQLNERILQASKNDKDFFFLTAILDRNVKDELVQAFRKENKDFKQDLLLCWDEAESLLLKATGNIREALDNEYVQREISARSPVYQKLVNTIPGGDHLNQLLVCLKVINDAYRRNKELCIADFVQDIKAERKMRDSLDDIFGIGPKLANWAVTNFTGHWFVIDEPHIKPLIERDLADTLPSGMAVSLESADAIFEHWFGKLDETSKEYEGFSRKKFAAAFPDFPVEASEYLPFIVTQCLWFYDMFYGNG